MIITWNIHSIYYYPPKEAGIRMVDRLCGDHEVAKVHQAKPGLKQFVGGEDRVFAANLKGFASTDAERQTDCDAAEGRVTRHIPIYRQPVVWGYQMAWQEHFTASEPLLVVVSQQEQICTRSIDTECAYADGIYRDGTPSRHAGAKTVLQDPDQGGDEARDPGGYRSLIARECVGGGCGPAHETGFVFAACPANGRSTTFMLRTNDYTRVGPIPYNMDVGLGKFTYEVTPDDPRVIAACKSHPAAGFIPLPPSTTASN
ncbi:MAG: hypothetical protein KW802_00575 [Candidatus Doudnabacteria bacterium]|nr:hypothetical protein [Candidatus Doudnabacteria bacterium]